MTQMERKTMKEWFDPDGKVTCKRLHCGHRWWPKSDKKPVSCPKCKSYDWDKPHEIQKEER